MHQRKAIGQLKRFNAGPHLAALENQSAVTQSATGALNATFPLEKSPKGESLSVQFACRLLKELEDIPCGFSKWI